MSLPGCPGDVPGRSRPGIDDGVAAGNWTIVNVAGPVKEVAADGDVDCAERQSCKHAPDRRCDQGIAVVNPAIVAMLMHIIGRLVDHHLAVAARQFPDNRHLLAAIMVSFFVPAVVTAVFSMIELLLITVVAAVVTVAAVGPGGGAHGQQQAGGHKRHHCNPARSFD